jgi:hypothetical protein
MFRILTACALVVAVGILLALVRPSPVISDSGLTALVNSTYVQRTEDAVMHDIAHQRAVEIASDWSHNGMRDGTAEVLAYNSGFADPIAKAISQWQGSPSHAAILSDPSYTRIGCAEHVTDGTHWFACVLAAGPSPASMPTPGPEGQPSNVGGSGAQRIPLPASTQPPVPLPDTAMPHGGAGQKGG